MIMEMASQYITSDLRNLNLSDLNNDTKEKLHKCDFHKCNKVFGKKSRLVQHKRTHTGERPYMCSNDGCDRSYTRNFHLTRHITKAHGSPVEIIEESLLCCDICENIYSNKYSLEKHKKTHKSFNYNCSICGRCFRKAEQFESHSYEHTGLKPYKCEYPECSKSFQVASKLTKHTAIHIPNRYKCYHKNCAEAFNGFNQYRKHLIRDHPKVCIECKEEFETHRKLLAHLKTHQDKETFHCCFAPCDRYYFHEKNLKVHIQTKHDSNFQGLKCINCDKFLSSKQKLNEHMKTIHSQIHRQKIKSDKPRKPRKDKGIPKRSIYSLLSGHDDSKTASESSNLSNTVSVIENGLIEVNSSFDENSNTLF